MEEHCVYCGLKLVNGQMQQVGQGQKKNQDFQKMLNPNTINYLDLGVCGNPFFLGGGGGLINPNQKIPVKKCTSLHRSNDNWGITYLED